MGSQFYQPSFIPQKSFADDIYKGEQLDLAKENQALKKEQLWEAKSGKAKRITAGWSGHAAGTEAAYKSAFNKREEAKHNRDLQGVRDADRIIEELNLTAQHSAEWGKQFDATSKEARQNGYKYTKESLDEWDRYEGAQRNAAGVNEDGLFTVDGKVVGENGWNPYQQMPQLVTKQRGFLESAFTAANKVTGGFTQGNNTGGRDYLPEKGNAFIDSQIQAGIESGQLSQEDVPEAEAALRSYIQTASYDRDQSDSTYNYGGFGWTRKPTTKEAPFIDVMVNTKPADGVAIIDTRGLEGVKINEPDFPWKGYKSKVENVTINTGTGEIFANVSGENEIGDKKKVTLTGKEARNLVNKNFGTLWQEWIPSVDKVDNSGQGVGGGSALSKY